MFKATGTIRRGFTLVEVLIVVTIIGIAGAIVVPQMLTAGTLGIQAAARMVISDILYAQNEAIANQATRKIIFDVIENSYRLSDVADVTITASWIDSDSQNYVIDFDETTKQFGRIKIKSVNFDGNSELAFDALGAPSNGGTIEVEYLDTVYRVTVAAFTGRVTVMKL